MPDSSSLPEAIAERRGRRAWRPLGLQGRLAALLLALVVAPAAIGGAGLWAFNTALQHADAERLESGVRHFEHLLKGIARSNLATASLFVTRPEAQAALRAETIEDLLKATERTFAVAAERLGAHAMHFHSPDSVPLLTLATPGTETTSAQQREMVAAVNADRAPRQGLLRGEHYLLVRAAVPVPDAEGAHLGTFDVTTVLNDALLRERFTSGFIVTVLAATATGELRRVAGTSDMPPLLPREAHRAGLAAPLGALRAASRPGHWIATAAPLRDWQGNVVGVMEVAVDVAPTRAALDRALTTYAAVLALLLSLAVGGAVFVGRAITRALREIGQVLSVLARGEVPSSAMLARGRADEIGDLARSVEAFRDGLRRRGALLRELDHRVKNTLATVQSLAGQTLRSAGSDPQRFARDFQGRLIALASAHDLLSAFGWEAVDLNVLVSTALSPWLGGEEGRVTYAASFQDARLGAAQTRAIRMALHELASNAVRHGALSREGGTVAVTGSRPGGELVEIVWAEAGAPHPSGPPPWRGFGLRFLQEGLARDLGREAQVTLAFADAGLRATIRFRPSPSAT